MDNILSDGRISFSHDSLAIAKFTYSTYVGFENFSFYKICKSCSSILCNVGIAILLILCYDDWCVVSRVLYVSYFTDRWQHTMQPST
jgi:hypothetical protein